MFIADYTGIKKTDKPVNAAYIAIGDTNVKAYRLFILVSIFLLSTPPVSVAQETPEKPFLAKPFMKFARGAVNMISAPLEVPNQVYLLSDYATENSPYGIETASAAIEGLFTGIGFAVWRFAAGTYDVITFPVPRYESCLITPPYLTASYEAYYNKVAQEQPEEDIPPPSEPGTETE